MEGKPTPPSPKTAENKVPGTIDISKHLLRFGIWSPQNIPPIKHQKLTSGGMTAIA